MQLKFIITLGLFSFFISCTSEEEKRSFTVVTRNQSSVELNVLAYFENQLIEDIRLQNEESGFQCTYSFESFSDYNCDYDSIVFRFPNAKGYILYTPEFGFSDARYETLYIVNNGIYELTLTQGDYENAHELPE